MIERNIHHAGKFPRRTCAGVPQFSKVTGKWSAVFDLWAGIPGAEYKASTITSGSFFDTEDAASAAADRALDMLQATDKFPNMCEVF